MRISHLNHAVMAPFAVSSRLTPRPGSTRHVEGMQDVPGIRNVVGLQVLWRCFGGILSPSLHTQVESATARGAQPRLEVGREGVQREACDLLLPHELNLGHVRVLLHGYAKHPAPVHNISQSGPCLFRALSGDQVGLLVILILPMSEKIQVPSWPCNSNS